MALEMCSFLICGMDGYLMVEWINCSRSGGSMSEMEIFLQLSRSGSFYFDSSILTFSGFAKSLGSKSIWP